jgi:hypothetical protein
LKKTNEFGDQASRLEQEYERMFSLENTKDGGLLENLQLDSANKPAPEVIEKCGIKIPKLDFTSIYI